MDEKEKNALIEKRIKDERGQSAMTGALMAACLILGPLGFMELIREEELPAYVLIFIPIFIYLSARKLWGDAVRPYEAVGRWPAIYNIASSIMIIFAFAGVFSVLDDMGKSDKLRTVCEYIEDTTIRTQIITEPSAYRKKINRICAR